MQITREQYPLLLSVCSLHIVVLVFDGTKPTLLHHNFNVGANPSITHLKTFIIMNSVLLMRKQIGLKRWSIVDGVCLFENEKFFSVFNLR
jgi:hypothetical protein